MPVLPVRDVPFCPPCADDEAASARVCGVYIRIDLPFQSPAAKRLALFFVSEAVAARDVSGLGVARGATRARAGGL